MNVPITRYEVIEIQIPNGTTLTQFNFPDMPNLRNAKILAIDYYSENVITKSPNTGATPLTTADQKNCFINIYQGDLQRIKNLPLSAVGTVANSDSSTDLLHGFNQIKLNGIVVSWTKCFLKFNTTPATNNVVVSFGVTYVQPEDVGYSLVGQNL